MAAERHFPNRGTEMRIHELRYSATNTYLIEGECGRLLFDTGWAGTYDAFCRAMGELRIPVQSIDYILISHYHPDHMGIAQEIADRGAVIVAMELQRPYIHTADTVFAKENKVRFQPIDDAKLRVIRPEESRGFLAELGIGGEIIPTPGHSDDSITLALDDGSLFVGDLNPLYELELHKGTMIAESWKRLLAGNPKTVYYGHAKTARLNAAEPEPSSVNDRFALVAAIVKGIDKGWDIAKIRRKTDADEGFIEDVMRMYLTHQNIGVQGILDRIEIKNK